MPAQRVSQGVPVEDFVQALTAQLDRAQDALALKARTGRPLTFALKDLSIDLRVFWETDARGRLVMRHAGPNEDAASTVRLGFTTITRAMVEENTVSLGLEEDPRALQDLRGTNNLNEDDRRRLEMVGVRTVGQLRRLSSGTNPTSVETYLGIPVMRLRAALEQASRPAVLSQEMGLDDEGPLLYLRGVNLADASGARVSLDGEPVEVLQASPSELVVRPRSHHREGRLEVFAQGQQVTSAYRLPGVKVEVGKTSNDAEEQPGTAGPGGEASP